MCASAHPPGHEKARRQFPACGPVVRFAYRLAISKTLRTFWKKGEWEFATLSFPDHWHLAPNFTRRVSLAVSFPTLRRTAWTIASRSGPATEPAIGIQPTSGQPSR